MINVDLFFGADAAEEIDGAARTEFGFLLVCNRFATPECCSPAANMSSPQWRLRCVNAGRQRAGASVIWPRAVQRLPFEQSSLAQLQAVTAHTHRAINSNFDSRSNSILGWLAA